MAGVGPVVAQAEGSWYRRPMDQTPFELPPAQQGLRTTLSCETGQPLPGLVDEAWAGLQEQGHSGHDHGTGEADQPPPVASPQEAPKPIGEIFEEASRESPDEALARLRTDLAAQVEHSVYGGPKRSPCGLSSPRRSLGSLSSGAARPDMSR